MKRPLNRFSARLIFIATALALACGGWLFNRDTRLEKGDRRLSTCGERLCFNSQPFSGIVLEHYQTGQLLSESHYLDGYQDGARREFGFGGQLRNEWHFHLGQKDGWQRGWYLEGPKRFESHFKNGRLDGLSTEWHLNGGVFRTQNFSDGVERDKKILYPTGEIFTNYSIRDSRIYGVDGGALCFEPPREGQRL